MESMGFVGRLRWVVAVLAGAAALALSRGQVAAQSPQQVQQLADQTIRRLDLQTSFPVVPEPIRFTLPSEILWIVIGLALVVMLYAFRDLIPILRSGQGSDWMSEEASGGGGKVGSPAAALGAADELAAAGRFVEAMHVLLLQGLAAIRSGLDEELAACRRRLDALDPGTIEADRAAAGALAIRAAAALMTSVGSRSVLHTEHSQRLAREALFTAVYALRPASRNALLDALGAT